MTIWIKMRQIWILLLLGPLMFSLSNACSGSGTNTRSTFPPGAVSGYDHPRFFFSSMKKVEVEVAYEPGAEPYTDNTPHGQPYWSILQENLQALFAGRQRSVEIAVPTNLQDMRQITPQNREEWTVQDILSAAATHRSSLSDIETGRFFILFVNGVFAQNGQRKPSVLGVSIGGTSIIAIFKDVVRGTSLPPNGVVAKYVEQSTTVHEMGHALGLVNNGVPHTSNHHDHEHGAHCTNDACVMYWLNEGASDMVAFVQDMIVNGNVVMFDNACLTDARSYSP